MAVLLSTRLYFFSNSFGSGSSIRGRYVLIALLIALLKILTLKPSVSLYIGTILAACNESISSSSLYTISISGLSMLFFCYSYHT